MPCLPAAAHPPRNVHRSPATGTAPSASVGVPPSSRGCPAAGPIIPRSTITPTPYCTPIAPVESRWGRRCLQQSSPLLRRGKQGSSPPPNTPCAFSLKLGRHILHTLTPAAHPITEHEISWVRESGKTSSGKLVRNRPLQNSNIHSSKRLSGRHCLAATVLLGLSLRQPGIILMLGRPLFKKGMMAFPGLVRAVEETGGLARQLL